MKKINYYKRGHIIKYDGGGTFDDILSYISMGAPYLGAGIGAVGGAFAGGVGAAPGGAAGYEIGNGISSALDTWLAARAAKRGDYVGASLNGASAAMNWIPGLGSYYKFMRYLKPSTVKAINTSAKTAEELMETAAKDSAKELAKNKTIRNSAIKTSKDIIKGTSSASASNVKTAAEAAEELTKRNADDIINKATEKTANDFAKKAAMDSATKGVLKTAVTGSGKRNAPRILNYFWSSGQQNQSAPPVQRGDGSMLKVDTVTKKPLAVSDTITTSKGKQLIFN